MKFRRLLFCFFAFVPLTALADDLSGGQAQAPQTAVGASDLLPQSGNQSGVSSTEASSVLQPNASSLQGSSTDGSALSTPTGQTLQAGTANENLKVLLGGEADGAPKNINDSSSSSLGEDIASVALGILILCITIGVLRRRATRQLFEV